MTRPTDAAVAKVRSFLALSPSSIAAVVASGSALVVVALESPMALRVPALVVLLWVPGAALVRLLAGDTIGSPGDRAVRIPLSVLLGILSWLAVAMLLNGFRISVGPTSLALGVATTGLVLVILAGIRRRPTARSSTPPAVAARVSGALRSGASLAAAAAVIVAATCCATTLISKPVERYTTLGLVDSKPFAAEIPAVRRGQTVRLNWVLHAVGCVPSPELTSVRLTVDGNAVGDVAVDINGDGDTDGTLTGAATFTAPKLAGRHLVELAVLPTADGGGPLPAPGFVSTFLEVQR
jgi:hypothetical protein